MHSDALSHMPVKYQYIDVELQLTPTSKGGVLSFLSVFALDGTHNPIGNDFSI